MNTAEILMYARWTGMALIVLGWFQVIPLMLAWIGFGIAAVAFILESVYKKNLSSPKKDDNPGQ